VLFIGMWKPAFSKPLPSAVLAILFALASFLPTAAINIRHCGDWTGAAAEDVKLGSVEPLVGIATNSINAILQNSVPPVFPVARQCHQFILPLFPDALIEANYRSFEQNGAQFNLPDFQGEESAGIGIGLTALLVISLIMSISIKVPVDTSQSEACKRRRMVWSIAALTFSIALLAYFSRAGMSTVGRHIAPFYPFFFALFLSGRRQDRVVSSSTWKFAAIAAVVSAFVIVIISPSRPLWPANILLSQIDEQSPRFLQRAKSGYIVYSSRSDGIGPVRDSLPTDATVVAYLSHGISAELPLWKPYMKRRVRHVLPDETLAILRSEGIRYLAMNTVSFEKARGMPAEDWVDNGGGIIRKRIPLKLMARFEPEEWWIVEIPPSVGAVVRPRPFSPRTKSSAPP
jgi:hypothetical protein